MVRDVMNTLVETSSLVGAVYIIWQQLEDDLEIKSGIRMKMEEKERDMRLLLEDQIAGGEKD